MEMRKRDTIMLLILCGLVLFTSGALRSGGSARAKALMCTANMQKVGQGLSVYWGGYDGRMPNMNWDYTANGRWRFENCVRGNYVYSVYSSYVEPKQAWVLLGCLFKAGVIDDGRTFYCPATEGSLDEYKSYSNPAPWGNSTAIQQAKESLQTGNTWLRANKGYMYWPQGRLMVQSGYKSPYDNLRPLGDGMGWGRYQVGQPAPPLNSSDLDIGKAIAVDHESQPDGTGGYKVDALFPDGHTNYQPVPKHNDDGTMKWLCPYQGSRPTAVNPYEWYGDGQLWVYATMMSNYMYLLQP
jgi:hypothetical protein